MVLVVLEKVEKFKLALYYKKLSLAPIAIIYLCGYRESVIKVNDLFPLEFLTIDCLELFKFGQCCSKSTGLFVRAGATIESHLDPDLSAH